MTIASEIERLQTAKADIKASIEWKWVSVPSGAKLDTYDTYIDQIATTSINDIFVPTSFSMIDWIHNTDSSPYILDQMWDNFKADNSAYYRYFWLRDDDTTAYSKFRICVWTKTPWNDPTTARTDRIANDRLWWWRRWWRMKKSWNDIIFSALYYVSGSSYNVNDNYYCVNATNNTFSSPVSLWTVTDYSQWWEERIYGNWTNSCGITSEESISGINKVTFSLSHWHQNNYRSLIATLNN